MFQNLWNHIVQNTTVYSLIISFVALLLSLYSVYYTRKNNRHKIKIGSAFYYPDKEKPTMISFKLFNDSNKATTLKDVVITHENGEEINFLPKFDPDDFYNGDMSNVIDYRLIADYEYQSPFTGHEIIPSNSSVEYSYYLEGFENPLKVKIKSEQLINWFKKEKSFTTHFYKSD